MNATRCVTVLIVLNVMLLVAVVAAVANFDARCAFIAQEVVQRREQELVSLISTDLRRIQSDFGIAETGMIRTWEEVADALRTIVLDPASQDAN